MSYGLNIKAARKNIGMTQEQLAQKCGMAAITIQQYERGVRQPRLEQLQTIATVLKVPVYALIGGEDAIKKISTRKSEPSISALFSSGDPLFQGFKRYSDVDGFYAYLYKLGFVVVTDSDGAKTITDIPKDETYFLPDSEFARLEDTISVMTKAIIDDAIDKLKKVAPSVTED